MTLPQLLDDVTARWESARHLGPAWSADLRIAERDLRITVVGAELAAIAQAALHDHAPAEGTPVAEVGAWDAAATGVALPARPPDVPRVARWTGTRGDEAVAEVALLDDGSIRTADRDACRYLLAVPSLGELSSWERGAPLRRQLLWALWPEAQLVHAAGVATTEGVALLAGRSGAGKSSTAMACAEAGLGFLGDDHCAITDGDPPTVHHLHASARLVPAELAHLPARAAAGKVDLDKALVWPSRRGGDADRSGPLRVILLTQPSGGDEPRFQPLRPAELLREIAPTMLRQQHVHPAGELRGLRRLAGAVPVWRLHLSKDRTRNPPAIAQAIAAPDSISAG